MKDHMERKKIYEYVHTDVSPIAGGAAGRVCQSQVPQTLFSGSWGSPFIAVMAQLSFRFPASPIPITGQTFAVLIVGMALSGSCLGALAALAYCLEGIYFPVFAEMRTWAHPFTLYTAGYLVGFIGAAYVTKCPGA